MTTIMSTTSNLYIFPSGLFGPGEAPPLPLPLPSGLSGSIGLPAPSVCHGVWGAEAHRPGWRQRDRACLSDGPGLHLTVPPPQLQPALLGPGSVWGPQRDEESLQRLQVIQLAALPLLSLTPVKTIFYSVLQDWWDVVISLLVSQTQMMLKLILQ